MRNGAVLPVGLDILVPIYLIHRDPRYFEQPDTFDPERFLPPRLEEVKPFTFLPFGDGPRACPGARFAILEVKSTLARILTHYELHQSDPSLQEIDVSKTVDEVLILGSFKVRFLPRKQPSVKST